MDSTPELCKLVADAERRIRGHLIAMIGIITLVAAVGTVVYHVFDHSMNRDLISDNRRFMSDMSRLNFQVTSLSLTDDFSSDQAESLVAEIQDLFERVESEQRRSLAYLIEEVAVALVVEGRVDLVQQLTRYIDSSSNDKPRILFILTVLGVRAVTEQYRSTEELELFSNYKDLTPSYPELHILYDALTAQEQHDSDVGEILHKTISLDKADRASFVRALSSMAKGEFPYRSDIVAKPACSLVYSDYRALPILQAVEVNLGDSCIAHVGVE